MTTDVVALDTAAAVAPLVGGGSSGRSPAKLKLTCACVSRGGDAQGSGRLPFVAAHPHTVGELICVGRSTRRADTYPPLSRHHRRRSSVMCTAYPSSPLNFIYPPSKNGEGKLFGTRKNKFLFRPTALQRASPFFSPWHGFRCVYIFLSITSGVVTRLEYGRTRLFVRYSFPVTE